MCILFLVLGYLLGYLFSSKIFETKLENLENEIDDLLDEIDELRVDLFNLETDYLYDNEIQE